MSPARHVVVVGGGLAGITAALDAADGGARVTLLERRRRLGGLTWSFGHDGAEIDNGQHVFLRCCTDYLGFLDRIGSAGDVVVQDRLDVTAIRPGAGRRGGPLVGRLRRNGLPAPLHLGPALLRYPHLPLADRARIGLAALPLRRLDLDDPALDDETFGSWLARHGQRPVAIETLWDLITVATVNLPASEASLAMGAKVFQTGLLTEAGAADIGWSRVPLGRLHGERATAALARAGVVVHLGVRVRGLTGRAPGWSIATDDDTIDADAVVVALPHTAAGAVLPPGSITHQDRLADLGTSGIVDVHVRYDRRVTDLPLAAGLGTPVQWVFDRTTTSGLAEAPDPATSARRPGAPGPLGAAGALGSPDPGGPAATGQHPARGPQYLAASLSAADDLLGRHPDELAAEIVGELVRMFPPARDAKVLDTMVTKERQATFRARPGTAALRPAATTAHAGLAVAGAWTDTGWPATMEGAVRSGHAAAAAVLAGTSVSRTPEEVA